jgi:hypothetical protein
MKDGTLQEDAQSLAQELGFQPGLVLRAFGMRRSGNHAVINWILRNCSGEHVFLNNCLPGRSAARSCRGLEVNGNRRSTRRRLDVWDATQHIQDNAALVISYEDVVPDPDDINGGLTLGLNKADVAYEVLLYRTFMNWAASMLRKLQSNEEHDVLARLRIMMSALDKYREILDIVANHSGDEYLVVNYDRWVARPRYRTMLLEQLGLPLIDNSLGVVQPYGGGSSFQKDISHAKELNTTDRWRHLVNEPDFQLVLLAASQDQELMALLRHLMPQDAQMLTAYQEQAQFPYHVQVGDE